MSGYTIAAIPTLYRGRMYRSRLEARWAAFFDRLGWTYEYEPFDLGAWSPDFLLNGALNGALVEVKPWASLDLHVCEKIGEAVAEQWVLLTRAAPIIVEDHLVSPGWLRAPGWALFQEAYLIWLLYSKKPLFGADIGPFSIDEKNPVSLWFVSGFRCYSKEHARHIFHYRDHSMQLWADACNAVQWEPRS